MTGLSPIDRRSRTFAFAVLLGCQANLCANDPLPEGAVAHFAFSPIPYNGGSRTSELSPDGKHLAMWSSGSATLWDTATGLPVQRFYFTVPAAPGYQRGFAFSPDGKRLAGGPSSELIIVWDLATGKEVRRFHTEFQRFGYSLMRFSADSASLIVESKEVLTWFDIETGKATRQIPYGWIKQLSPDEKTFVVVYESRKQLLIGDAATGTIKHTLPIATLFGQSHRSLLFLPDGVTIAVVCHEGYSIREVQFWDFKTGKRQDRTWTLTKSEGAGDYSLVLSPDGKILYFPEQRKSIRRFSLEANKELNPIELSGDYFFGLFAHPDGRTLFAIDDSRITRWDALFLQAKSSYKEFIDWHEPVMSPDGRWLARRGNQYLAGFLELFDTTLRQSRRIAWPAGNGALAFSSDSRSLIVNQSTHLQYYTLPELKEGGRINAPKDKPFFGRPMAISANGRYVVIHENGHGRVFDVEAATDVLSFSNVNAWSFSPDCKRLLTVTSTSRDFRRIQMQEIPTRKLLYDEQLPQDRNVDRSGRGASVTALAFSPDGRLCAMALSGGQVVFVDAATGKEQHRFLGVETSEKYYSSRDSFLFATALAFSADGQWLVVCGGGLARVWDVATRLELHRFPGYWGSLLAFSGDGRRLFSFGGNEGFLSELRPKETGDKASDAVADLLALDGPVAYRAIWTLADDPRGPAMLREQIPPKRVDARPERIAKLIADLDAEVFQVRDAAMKALAELEGSARPALHDALKKKPALETDRRIKLLLAGLAPDVTLRNARAVKAMELSDAPAARKLLEEWAAGSPGLYLTDDARAALSRRKRE